MFPVQGITEIWQLVLDVAWLNLPGEPKLYVEFVRQLADVATEHGGAVLVGAAADMGQARVALFYSDRNAAVEFEGNWRTVARKVRAEIAASRRTFDFDDIPF